MTDWLSGPRDYDEGLALAHKYIRNRSILNYLTRHRDQRKLEYELGKISGKGKKPDATKCKENENQEYSEKIETTGRKLVVFDDHVHLDDLPAHLKPLYLQNRELYKQMRALHEKMKLATSDTDRAKYRAQLVEYDDIVSENWKTLDAWDGTTEAPQVETEKLTDEEKEKQVASARKFVSVNLKKAKAAEGLKRQQLVFKIAERVNLLVTAGVNMGEAMKLELKKLGIDS